MPIQVFQTLRFASAILATVAVGIFGLFLMLPQGDASLRAAFASALEARGDALSVDVGSKTTGVPKPAGVAASEEEWLGSANGGVLKPVAWEAGVSIGDQITISTSLGPRVLKVVGVSVLSNGVTQIDTDAHLDQSFVVTAQEVGRADDGIVMRFIVDSPGSGTPLLTTRLGNRSL